MSSDNQSEYYTDEEIALFKEQRRRANAAAREWLSHPNVKDALRRNHAAVVRTKAGKPKE